MNALGGVAIILVGIFVAMLAATGRLGNVWAAISGAGVPIGGGGGGGGGGQFVPGGGGFGTGGAQGSFAQPQLSGMPTVNGALLNASSLGVPAVPGLTAGAALG